jgi:hypothetical protein
LFFVLFASRKERKRFSWGEEMTRPNKSMPKLYTTSGFLDRKKQIKLILDWSGEFADRFVFAEFVGLPGIGKTWILEHARGLLTEKGVVPVLLSLAQNRYQHPLRGIWELAYDISQITRNSPGFNRKLEDLLNQFMISWQELEEEKELSPESLNQLEKSFVPYLNEFLEHKQLALLFDNVDDAPQTVKEDLIALISRFKDQAGLLVLLSAKRSLKAAENFRWPDAELRKNMESYTVEPFGLDDTLAMLPESMRNRAEETYKHTRGHPLANQVVGDKVAVWKDEQNLEKQIAISVDEDVIRGYILQEGRSLDESMPEVFVALAIPRFFTVSTMRALLEQNLPERFGSGLTTPQAYNLIGNMVASGLAKRNTELEVIEIAPTLRRMMASALEIRQPEAYRAGHQFMLEYYTDRSNGTNTPPVLITERLFHLASLSRAEGLQPEKIYERLRRQAQQDIELFYPADRMDLEPGGLIFLNARLSDDMDLAELLGEQLDALMETVLDIQRIHSQQLMDTARLIVRKVMPAEEEKYEIMMMLPDQPLLIQEPITLTSPLLNLKQTATVGDEQELVTEMNSAYALVLPKQVRDALEANRELPLEIHTNEPRLTWELLHDGQEYLCLSRPVGKTVIIENNITGMRNYVEPITSEHPTIHDLKALLLIDPTGELVGAQREGEAIYKTLTKAGIPEDNITVLTGKAAYRTRVTVELASGQYHLIHFAGHGEFDAIRPEKSQLRLTNGKLSAEELGRVVKGNPIFFLNACRSAEITDGFEGLAAQLLWNGARACLGNLWKVSDGFAVKFSSDLYDLMFRGNTICESLMKVRAKYRDAKKKEWASYVLYGSPGVRLF